MKILPLDAMADFDTAHLNPHVTDQLTCPHCLQFTFFSQTSARFGGAKQWMKSMARWIHAPSHDGTCQGIAILKCANPACKMEFGIRLSADLYEAYRQEKISDLRQRVASAQAAARNDATSRQLVAA